MEPADLGWHCRGRASSETCFGGASWIMLSIRISSFYGNLRRAAADQEQGRI